MKNKNLIIKSREIMLFLQENGWEKQISKDGKLIRFVQNEKNLSHPVFIFFSNGDCSDEALNSQVIEAMHTIRQFYGVKFESLQHKLAVFSYNQEGYPSTKHDLLTTRISDKYVKSDTVDMSIALLCIEYLQSAIKDAAFTASRTMRKPGIFAEAKQYAETCRFSHTFRGSFGFAIEFPLCEDQQLSFNIFDSTLPLGRSISKRICNGFSSIEKAFKKNDVDIIVNQNDGFDANMCISLADFLDNLDMPSIQMGIKFDNRLEIDQKHNNEDFVIHQSFIPIIRKAGEILTPEEILEKANIVGRVVGLRSLGNPAKLDDPAQRTVTVRWESKSKSQNISFRLGPIEYSEAIRAHENGYYVQVRGTLIIKGRISYFSFVDNFSVLD